MSVILLTAEEVAAQLKVRSRTVRTLGLPVVMVGGSFRYKQSDVEAYIASHTVYSGGQNVSVKKKKGRIVGLSVLPSRATLQKIRLSGSQGGKGSGSGSPN